MSQKQHTSEFEKCIQDVVASGKEKGAAFAICTSSFEKDNKPIWAEALWDTAYVNDLSDSAFAAIEPGGEKDEQGKTTPRSLRHLEHHNAEDNVDEAHVKAALQRLNQTNISDALRAEAKRHLCGHAKQMDFVSEVCGEEPPVSESVKLYLFSESINLEGNLVSGVAIHPKSIWHPEAGNDFKAKHDYLKEELKKAAESLKGKPFGEDHLRLLAPPNSIFEGHWDEQQNGVAFKGIVSDAVAQRIRNKEYKGLSVEIDWKKPGKYVMLEKTNGTAPRNFEFTSVHFLRQFPPGDKEAYVKLMEGIVLPIVPPPLDIQIDMIRELFEERIRYLEGQINAMSHNAGTLGLQSPAIVIFKEAESKFTSEIGQLKDIVKTLVKLKESYVTEKKGLEESVTTKKTEFDGALKLLAERLNVPPTPEPEGIVAIRKEKFDVESKLKLAESKLTQGLNEAELKYRKLHKEMVESIPYPHIWASWGAGPKMMVQRQLGILGVQPNNYYG